MSKRTELYDDWESKNETCDCGRSSKCKPANCPLEDHEEKFPPSKSKYHK